MRIPRIYCDVPLDTQREVTLDDRACHYIRQVLRLKSGAPLTLFNGNGHDYDATLLTCHKEGCTATVSVRGDAEPAPPLDIHLAIGVSRGERMDLVLQKSVELGISRITPLFTERSVVRLQQERLRRRETHWLGVAISACEQSGRRRLVTIDPATGIDELLSRPAENGVILQPDATLALPALPNPAGRLSLLVGPEGGFTAAEAEQAVAQGYRPVRLGPRVLRTETAPLAAIAIAQAIWGDLRG